jgi:hypothetical protein
MNLVGRVKLRLRDQVPDCGASMMTPSTMNFTYDEFCLWLSCTLRANDMQYCLFGDRQWTLPSHVNVGELTRFVTQEPYQ